MSNMLKAKVVLSGYKPILFHYFNTEVLTGKGEEEKPNGGPGNNPDEWKKSKLMTKDGQLFIPASYAFACIRDGAKHTKRGLSSLQKKVSATLQVIEDRILVNKYMPENIEKLVNRFDEPVYIDLRAVKNPTTKARNLRYRIAASVGWEVEFTIVWDKTLINREEMLSCIIDAGQLEGLGDGRTIGFGRFIVKNFEVIEDAKIEIA